MSKVHVTIVRLSPSKNKFMISFAQGSISRSMPIPQQLCILFFKKKKKNNNNNSKLETSDSFSSYAEIILRRHKTSQNSTSHENVQTPLQKKHGNFNQKQRKLSFSTIFFHIRSTPHHQTHAFLPEVWSCGTSRLTIIRDS